MKKIITYIGILFIVLLSVLPANAQQTAEKFVQELHYLLYLPDGYATDTTQRWPLMLFLHGSGESGTDLEKVKAHGPPKLIAQGKKMPFIVISPQATNGWKAEELMGLVNDVKKKYKVDNDRVYITGLSMGGFGTWALAEEYPSEFAAIAPICGGGDTSKVWTLRHMPVWNFHGAKDGVVPLQSSVAMVDALKKYNPTVKFTIYPEANHDSWTETYNNEALYTWLLAQKKFKFTETSIKPALLKEYAGAYLARNNDTIVLAVQGNMLEGSEKGKKTMELRPAADNLFYYNENTGEDIRFIRNSKGVVTALELWGRRKMRLEKVMVPVKKKVD